MKLTLKLILVTIPIVLVIMFSTLYIVLENAKSTFIDRAGKSALFELNLVSNEIEDVLKSSLDEDRVIQFIRIKERLSDMGFSKSFEDEISVLVFYNEDIIYPITVVESFPSPYKDTLTILENEKKIVANNSLTGDLRYYSISVAKDLSYIDTLLNQWMFKVLSVFSIAMLLITSLFTFVIRKTLVQTKRIVGIAKNITVGNYKERIQVEDMDELGILSLYVNKMTDSIENSMKMYNREVLEKKILLEKLAHELYTPLTSIYGFANILDMPRVDVIQKNIAIEHIKHEATRLIELSKKLLDNIDSKVTDLNFEKNRFDLLLGRALMILELDIKNKNISIIKDIKITEIWGDSVLLTSFLVNILSNSIKASKEGNEIKITLNHINGLYSLEIEDYGNGIKNDSLEELLEPYIREKGTYTLKQKGYGLGLSICKDIADLHNGELVIFSKENVGTTVKLILPDCNNSIDIQPPI